MRLVGRIIITTGVLVAKAAGRVLGEIEGRYWRFKRGRLNRG